MKTKFGNARINSNGYYIITSGKEGNNGKYLHRLIWEDFYGCEVPNGYIIHHKDFNPKNNCILNLQLMRLSDHIKLHNQGKIHTDETKKKMSESKKGKTLSEEHKKKISESNMGHEVSEETRKKISESKKGKYTKENSSQWKPYARIVKKNKERGKQKYVIKFNGKEIKYSFFISKLIDWFSKEYPTEILKLPNNKED